MKKKNISTAVLLFSLVIVLAAVCLFTGSSDMTFSECINALLGKGPAADIRIVRSIRVPRMLAAVTAGAGLSVSGLVMQTSLNNPMASPSTLGVSNAAVFGANLSIIVFAGGFLDTGNRVSGILSAVDPFAAGVTAFIFALISVLLILGLCRIRSFSPSVVVLSGIAIGSVWTAATTLIQFYATDVGLSAAVIWSFGDLGRATYRSDIIMFIVVLIAFVFFMLSAYKYNALLSGEIAAGSLGVNVGIFRFITLMLASAVTAVCVSFLGIIGFVGVICPHIVKKAVGQDHRVTLPFSAACGSILLLTADIVSRSIGRGSAIPVGAVTALLGAPFFVGIVLSKRGEGYA